MKLCKYVVNKKEYHSRVLRPSVFHIVDLLSAFLSCSTSSHVRAQLVSMRSSQTIATSPSRRPARPGRTRKWAPAGRPARSRGGGEENGLPLHPLPSDVPLVAYNRRGDSRCRLGDDTKLWERRGDRHAGTGAELPYRNAAAAPGAPQTGERERERSIISSVSSRAAYLWGRQFVK